VYVFCWGNISLLIVKTQGINQLRPIRVTRKPEFIKTTFWFERITFTGYSYHCTMHHKFKANNIIVRFSKLATYYDSYNKFRLETDHQHHLLFAEHVATKVNRHNSC